VAVLAALAELGLATREHLQTLFFPSRERATQRLARLYHHSLVDRHFYSPAFFDLKGNSFPSARSFGSAPFVYTLTADGWDQVGAARGEEAAQALRKRASSPPNPLFLAHTLAAVDLHVALWRASQQAPEESLLAWHQAGEAQQEEELWEGEQSRIVRLRPDGLAFYQMGPQGFLTFVEIDRGSERGGKVPDKLERYGDLIHHGHLLQRYRGWTDYRILFVAPSSPRRDSLQGYLAEVMEDPEHRRRVWWGLREHVSADGLREVVWGRGDEPTGHSFLPPLAGAGQAGPERL